MSLHFKRILAAPVARPAAMLLIAAAALGAATVQSSAQQVLRATGTGSNAPFHFLDSATGAQRGISVDLINAVAADLGMTVEWGALTPVADLNAVIIAGAFDVYAGAINVSPARLEQVAMTIPWYISTGDGMWVPKTDTTDYRSLQDFRGLVIGAVRGSGFATALEGMPGAFAEVRLYDTPSALARAVVAGEVRGGIVNGTTAAYTLFQGNYPELQVPPNYQGTVIAGAPQSTPMSKLATDLVARFNDSLAKLMIDGTVTRIFAEYGLSWPLRAP